MGVSELKDCPEGEGIKVWIDNLNKCSRSMLCRRICKYNVKEAKNVPNNKNG